MKLHRSIEPLRFAGSSHARDSILLKGDMRAYANLSLSSSASSPQPELEGAVDGGSSKRSR